MKLLTVYENVTFKVTVNIKGWNNGVYALNITLVGSDIFNGTDRLFDSYLTANNAIINIQSIDKIIVEYGVNYVIANVTLNSTKFGANYTGNITVTINDLSNKTTAVNGTFSVKIINSTPFKVGNYTIIASGSAVSNYNAVALFSLPKGLEVVGVVPDFVISTPSIGYGENATVYIMLPDDATGKVIIHVSSFSFLKSIKYNIVKFLQFIILFNI